MFHTSSLLHDDVIDHAETRRGKPSVNTKWTQLSSIHAGVYILSISTRLLGQIGDPEVIESMTQILYDLVNGEFQQMTSRSLLSMETFKKLKRYILELTKMTGSNSTWIKLLIRQPV